MPYLYSVWNNIHNYIYVVGYLTCITVFVQLVLPFTQSNEKENNAPTEHYQHHCSTHDGHNCGDSGVLKRAGSSSLLCGCTVQAVWRVELRDCQSTWTWFNDVGASINSIWILSSLAKRLERLAFKDARFTAFGDSNDAESLALKMT